MPGPTQVDGVSFAPLITAGATQAAVAAAEARIEHRPLYAHRWANNQDLWSVIRDDWKLIDAPVGQELFDLDADPQERVNVFEDHPEKVTELELLLDAYRARDYHPDSRRASVELGDDLLERLQALGYIEFESKPPDDAGANGSPQGTRQEPRGAEEAGQERRPADEQRRHD